jgi:transcriptional regulator CtsR
LWKAGEGMSNLADIIEQFILRKLAKERDDIVVLKRNEVAEEIECAPSQISYVLSTRFTIERGFIVESRRGMGGFVRIARIPLQTIIYENAADQMDVQTSLNEAIGIIRRLCSQGMLTEREAALISNFSNIIYENMQPRARAEIMKQIFLHLAQLS